MKEVSAHQLVSLTADPASPPDGAMWYRSDKKITYTRANSTTQSFQAIQLAVAAGTVTINTTATDMGFSIPVSAGVYNLAMYIPTINSGTITNTAVTISGPAVDADWLVAFTRYASAAPTALYTRTTAAALAATTGATTLASVNLITASGAVRFNASGNVTVAVTMTGVATTQTARIGSYLQLTRIG
jgi:hypothetical protein